MESLTEAAEKGSLLKSSGSSHSLFVVKIIIDYLY